MTIKGLTLLEMKVHFIECYSDWLQLVKYLTSQQLNMMTSHGDYLRGVCTWPRPHALLVDILQVTLDTPVTRWLAVKLTTDLQTLPLQGTARSI